MKVTLPLPVQSITRPVPDKSPFLLVCELVKVRLTSLVVLTTLVGFYMGSAGAVDFQLMFHTVCGTALVACGAAALNQLLERDYDAKMLRTQDRPLPSGRMRSDTAGIFGVTCGVLGLSQLALGANLMSAAIGGITFATYLFIYTPLKRVSWLNTLVGAVPGALPPLIGWAAARGELTLAGWSLFGIILFWQIPHFLAIAWLYRDEYAKAGFVMLPNVDPTGTRTARVAVAYTAGLFAVSVLPVVYGMVGATYLFGVTLLGVIFLALAIQFSRKLQLANARNLFYWSIIYLPMVLILMVFDRGNG
jgi:protoheme IX farnesyltransferase